MSYLSSQIQMLIASRMESVLDDWNKYSDNWIVDITFRSIERWTESSNTQAIHLLKPNEYEFEQALETAFRDLFPTIVVYIPLT